jgi:hypothetical protein
MVNVVAFPLGSVVTNPPLKKEVSESGAHGVAKFPCATEWVLGKNLKVILSPMEAVAVGGEKERPFFPTSMRRGFVEAARDETVEMRERSLEVGIGLVEAAGRGVMLGLSS